MVSYFGVDVAGFITSRGASEALLPILKKLWSNHNLDIIHCIRVPRSLKIEYEYVARYTQITPSRLAARVAFLIATPERSIKLTGADIVCVIGESCRAACPRLCHERVNDINSQGDLVSEKGLSVRDWLEA